MPNQMRFLTAMIVTICCTCNFCIGQNNDETKAVDPSDPVVNLLSEEQQRRAKVVLGQPLHESVCVGALLSHMIPQANSMVRTIQDE